MFSAQPLADPMLAYFSDFECSRDFSIYPTDTIGNLLSIQSQARYLPYRAMDSPVFHWSVC